MYIEKRKQLRVDTHIPTEILIEDTKERLHRYLAEIRSESKVFEINDETSKTVWGYVKNISEGGMGVTSLDILLPGTKVIANISPIVVDSISSSAILVFAKIDGYLYYYGFKFIGLNHDKVQILKQLIRSLTIN